ALEGGAVEVLDVAEDAGGRAVGLGPGEQLEGGGVGTGQHVGLLLSAEAVDGAAVEGHALVEGALQLGGADGQALEGAEHVGEPQPHQADAALLDGPQHVLLASFHAAIVPARSVGAATDGGAVHTAFTYGKRMGNGPPPEWRRP